VCVCVQYAGGGGVAQGLHLRQWGLDSVGSNSSLKNAKQSGKGVGLGDVWGDVWRQGNSGVGRGVRAELGIRGE
jgi:hypothetical protein